MAFMQVREMQEVQTFGCLEIIKFNLHRNLFALYHKAVELICKEVHSTEENKADISLRPYRKGYNVSPSKML